MSNNQENTDTEPVEKEKKIEIHENKEPESLNGTPDKTKPSLNSRKDSLSEFTEHKSDQIVHSDHIMDSSLSKILVSSLMRIKQEAIKPITYVDAKQKSIHLKVVSKIDEIGSPESYVDNTQLSYGAANKYWLPLKLALLPQSSYKLKEETLDGIQKLLAYNLLTGSEKLTVDTKELYTKEIIEILNPINTVSNDGFMESVFSFWGSSNVAKEQGPNDLSTGRHIVSLNNIDGSLPESLFSEKGWLNLTQSKKGTKKNHHHLFDNVLAISDMDKLRNKMDVLCNLPIESEKSNFPLSTVGDYLIDDIIFTICKSISDLGSGASYDNMSINQNNLNSAEQGSNLEIQVLKAILTSITSTSCEIHGATLLAAIQTCINIFIYSKSHISRVTTRASLIQIINLVFSRMQKFCETLESVMISGSIENLMELETVTSNVPKSETELVKDKIISHHSTIPEGSEADNESGIDNSIDEATEINTPVKQERELSISSHKEKEFVGSNNPEQFNPYRPSIPFYYMLLKVDAYLVFRLLCRLSYSTTLDPIILNSISSHDSGSIDTNTDNSFHEISEAVMNLRKISLELIMASFNGPIIYSQDMYTDLVKTYLCKTVSRNGISTNPQLFELSISLFLLIVRFFRSKVKIEIEIILENIYLHILEMSNSTFKQKSLILQSLLKMCEDPQTIMDLFVNYDCDMQMKSLCERIISICSKICQVKSSIPAQGLSYFNIVSLGIDTKGQLIRAEERRLKYRALQCIVAIIQSLVRWTKPLDFIPNNADESLLKGDPIFVQQNSEQDKPKDINSTLMPEISTQPPGHQLSFIEALSATSQPNPIVLNKSPLAFVSFNSFSNAYSEFDNISRVSSSESHTFEINKVAPETSSTSPTNDSIYLNDDDSNENAKLAESVSSKKQVLKKIIKLFNEKPKKGISLAEEEGFIDITDPKSVVTFLKGVSGLSKTNIGEYLGEGEQSNILIMRAFIDSFDFSDIDFVPALRSLLKTFRLPGEAQKIDRIVEKFADRYCETNTEVFANADAAYTLAFSVILLNTDQHSPQIKHRMQLSDFIRNNRGINDNGDFPNEFLETVFEDIKNNEIIMEEEHAGNVAQITMSWGAGDITDKQRMEHYNKEIAHVTKKTRQLMATYNDRSMEPFRKASGNELARPFFGIHCWAMVAVLSTLLGTCPDIGKDWGESRKDDTELDFSDIPAAYLCLQGFAAGIKLACIFRMETERDAFVASLSQLTHLTHLTDFSMKNLRALRLLLAIGVLYGEYLTSSWIYILKAVSLQERLRTLVEQANSEKEHGILPSTKGLLSTTNSSNSIANYDKIAEELKVDHQTNFTEFLNGSNNMLTAGHESITNETSTPANGTEVKITSFELIAKNNAVAKLVEEIESQNIVLLVDKLFTNTVTFSAQAIVAFFNSLCLVSVDEACLNLEALTKHVPLEITSSRTPRLFLMQKVVEIAYYNITRIRFEWAQIWKILQPYFNLMACHPKLTVSVFAIDSLRQLSMKFFEKEELGHYSSQNDFLKSFELIMRNNKSPAIKELILTSIKQMIAVCSHKIRSGWKSIFVVLAKSTQGREKSPKIIISAMETMQDIFNNHIEAVITAGAFVDYVSSVAEFALINIQDNKGLEDVVVSALELLRSCAKYIEERPTPPVVKKELETEEHDIENINDAKISEEDSEKLITVDEDSFHLRWFPILSAFSRIILDSRLESVRGLAMDSLFELLDSVAYLFEPSYWVKINRSIILPIFQEIGEKVDVASHSNERSNNLQDDKFASSSNSSMLIHGIRLFINVISQNLEKLISSDGEDALRSLLNLMVEMLQIKDDKLATTGAICINQFLTDNIEIISKCNGWHVVTESLERAFVLTSPLELLLCEYPTPTQVRRRHKPRKHESLLSTNPLLFSIQNKAPVSKQPSGNLEENKKEERFEDLYAARVAYNLAGSAGYKVSLDSLDFDHTLVKCVTHLDLVQSLKQLALTVVEVDEKSLIENCLYNHRVAVGQTENLSAKHLGKKTKHYHHKTHGHENETNDAEKVNSGISVDTDKPKLTSTAVDNFNEALGIKKHSSENDTNSKRTASMDMGLNISNRSKGKIVYNKGISLRVVYEDKEKLNDDNVNSENIEPIKDEEVVTDSHERNHTRRRSDKIKCHKTSLINALPEECRSRWLAMIYASYAVARAFNEEYNLRYAIYKKGLVPQLPHLVKQETIALGSYIQMLFSVLSDKYGRSFTMYIFGIGTDTIEFPLGSEITGNAIVSNGADGGFTQMIMKMRMVSIVDSLVMETTELMERFLDYSFESNKYQLHLSLWGPIVKLILQQLTLPHLGWIWPKSSSKMLTEIEQVSGAHIFNQNTFGLKDSRYENGYDDDGNIYDDEDGFTNNNGEDDNTDIALSPEGMKTPSSSGLIPSTNNSEIRSTSPLRQHQKSRVSLFRDCDPPSPSNNIIDLEIQERLEERRRVREITRINYLFPMRHRNDINNISSRIYSRILRKYDQDVEIIRGSIPRYYELGVLMLTVEKQDLREFIKNFLLKVGLEYLA